MRHMDRRGEVHIAPDAAVPGGSMIHPELGRFWASWQDDDGVIEDVEIDGAEAAVAWGRERSDFVPIRLGHRGDTYFSAGEKHLEDDDGPLPRWPPAGPPPEGWWEPASEDSLF
jgi:hypothetical protein